ncbi:GvpL/GvpF family gas vesicle protein [Promicromonospora sp. NPDC057138]|uniref:GvpL/GvpF family gas vesicle protein n=1 Tax=Promicromonospora sp. NPDC057138 TaxID=3346031 RepID=UPI0036350BFD
MTSPEGLYVYAIVRGVPADPGTGIDGAPLHVVTIDGGLSAVVHHHAGGPYTGADDEVRRWVVEHNDAVDRLWQRRSTLLPMTFNVIVAGTEEESARGRLEDWLTTHAEELLARLDQLDDRVELRVEIGLDQQETARGDPGAEAVRAELEGRPPGVQRLLRKKLDRIERDVTGALADELYQEYRRRLAGVSQELTENRSARAEPGVVPVLSFSLLVRQEEREAVGRELAAIRDEQPAARIRYLGPWPPYSFADVSDAPTS